MTPDSKIIQILSRGTQIVCLTETGRVYAMHEEFDPPVREWVEINIGDRRPQE